MPNFHSSKDYDQFANRIVRYGRRVNSPHIGDFLENVRETGQKRIYTFSKESYCYRAQLGHSTENARRFPDDPGNTSMKEIRVPYPPERMKPSKEFPRESRANRIDSLCLYAASSADTAMSEVRPWFDSYISLATLRTNRDLNIMDCSMFNLALQQAIDMGTEDHLLNDEQIEEAVWSRVTYGFSKPVSHWDTKGEYAPTQELAELFRKMGCEGIKYQSLLGVGYTLALFDINSADVVDSSLHRTRSVQFFFDPAQ